MNRRAIREEIFKAIFQVDFHSDNVLEDQLQLFLEERTDLGEDKAYIEDKCKDIIGHINEIDEAINKASDNWKTSRMAKVDLSLLRIATYEIKYEGLEKGIAVNEAVEMAKKYSEANSYKFINGVLGNI